VRPQEQKCKFKTLCSTSHASPPMPMELQFAAKVQYRRARSFKRTNLGFV
jgi:hypothetical protein